MGGPFSVHSADLHCVWLCEKLRALMRRLGDLSVADTGILQWLLPLGNLVALQQFSDNVMVAPKAPTPHETIYQVCLALESIWNLRVLCPDCDKNPEAVCHGRCMRPSVQCMGVYIYVCGGLCVAHPNALDAMWQLKY